MGRVGKRCLPDGQMGVSNEFCCFWVRLMDASFLITLLKLRFDATVRHLMRFLNLRQSHA